MRSIWSGSIAFGLVIIPVKLYAAAEDRSVSFRQVHNEDSCRIQFRRFCTGCGSEVPYADIAKGYEMPTGDVVVITDDDFAALPLPTAKTISVLQFIPAAQVDPAWYGKPYYIEPQDAGIKPYALLREAISKAGRVALTKVALRSRESLAVVRADKNMLVLQMIAWPEEIRSAEFAFTGQAVPVADAEVAMAGQLIDAMTGDFDPGQYQDEYVAALQEMIQAKISGGDITPPAGLEPAAPAADLSSILQASIAALKPGSGPAAADAADAGTGTGRAKRSRAKKAA